MAAIYPEIFEDVDKDFLSDQDLSSLTETFEDVNYDFISSNSFSSLAEIPPINTESSPWPEPAGLALYVVNKVFDPNGPGNGTWEEWETQDESDPTGLQYPDPYGGGYPGSTTHRVQDRIYR